MVHFISLLFPWAGPAAFRGAERLWEQGSREAAMAGTGLGPLSDSAEAQQDFSHHSPKNCPESPSSEFTQLLLRAPHRHSSKPNQSSALPSQALLGPIKAYSSPARLASPHASGSSAEPARVPFLFCFCF